MGPGAHSHLSENGKWGMENGVGVRFANVYSPKQYIELVRETVECGVDGAAGGHAGPPLREMRQVAFVEEQTVEMEMADTAILALRLNEGLDLKEFRRRFGRSFDDVYGAVLDETASLGLLERQNGRVRLTERARLLANEVFVRLLAD